MSRCYLDTNFVYSHLRTPAKADGPFEEWRRRVVAATAGGAGVISALVIDELAYRLVLAWLRDDGDKDPLGTYRTSSTVVMRRMGDRLTACWDAVDRLRLELEPTDHAVVRLARDLMNDPGLAPRDAFHAAHAIQAGCSFVASSDAAFDRLGDVGRLGP